jgi:hypothetical protein
MPNISEPTRKRKSTLKAEPDLIWAIKQDITAMGLVGEENNGLLHPSAVIDKAGRADQGGSGQIRVA